MGFSYNKAMKLRPKQEKWVSTFLFSLLIGAAILVPYIFMEKNFFILFNGVGMANSGLITVDPLSLLGNYKLIFMEKYGMFFGGLIVFGFSFIPEWILPYCMGAFMVFRIAFSALAAYFFIRRFVRMPEAARLGAFLYAFSSAVLGITVNNAFQNAVVLFPIILLSAELLLTENRKMWLFTSVFACAILNTYAFWSVAVFLIIYLILRLTSKDVISSAAVIFRLFLEIILGALSAAVFLIPLIYICFVQVINYADFLGVNALINSQTVLEVLRSLFFPVESVNNSVVIGNDVIKSGMFGAFLPLLSFTGVIAFCGAKKGSSFKRTIVFSLILLLVPALNRVFSFANPSALYSWFYMPALIMSLVSVMAFEDRIISFSAGIKWSLSLSLILAAVILLFPTENENGAIVMGLYNWAPNKAAIIRFSIYVAIAVIGIIGVAIAYKMSENRSETLFNALSVATGGIGAILLYLYTATEIKFLPMVSMTSYSFSPISLSIEGLHLDRVLYYSQFITIMALGGFLIYLIICIATAKNRKTLKYKYPEGEALIKKWVNYEEENFLDVPFDEEFSLEKIANNLEEEYPVNYNSSEFLGGFNIVSDISKENSPK